MARSRYAGNDIVEGDSGRMFSSFDIPQSNSMVEPDCFAGVATREYTVGAGDRLDTLAARFLNDDQYGWAIALLNGIPPFLEIGQRIRIPYDVRDVLDRLGNNTRR